MGILERIRTFYNFKRKLDTGTPVRYIINEHTFGGVKMNLVHLHDYLDLPSPVLEVKTSPAVSQEIFTLYPQMPQKQVDHYLKQAAERKWLIYMQMNPNQEEKYIEVFGHLIKIKDRDQWIMASPVHDMHLIVNPHQVRHIRKQEKTTP